MSDSEPLEAARAAVQRSDGALNIKVEVMELRTAMRALIQEVEALRRKEDA